MTRTERTIGDNIRVRNLENYKDTRKMPEDLERLLAAARDRKITEEEQEQQRRSFAYGNTHFENERITRETVDRAAEELSANAKNGHSTR